MPSGPGISLFMNVRRPARAATLAAKRDVFSHFCPEREQRVYAVKSRAHTIPYTPLTCIEDPCNTRLTPGTETGSHPPPNTTVHHERARAGRIEQEVCRCVEPT